MNYKKELLEKSEEIILEIINKETKKYFKNNNKFDRYSKIYFEELDKKKLQLIYSEPEFIGWWNYPNNIHNMFSFKEIYRNKDAVSGIMLDIGGIALAKGTIKIGKDDWLREINIKKKYLEIFNHKNEYILKGTNTILIPEFQHTIIGKIFIKNSEKAEFGIEKPKNKTLEKMLYDIYRNSLSNIKLNYQP